MTHNNSEQRPSGNNAQEDAKNSHPVITRLSPVMDRITALSEPATTLPSYTHFNAPFPQYSLSTGHIQSPLVLKPVFATAPETLRPPMMHQETEPTAAVLPNDPSRSGSPLNMSAKNISYQRPVINGPIPMVPQWTQSISNATSATGTTAHYVVSNINASRPLQAYQPVIHLPPPHESFCQKPLQEQQPQITLHQPQPYQQYVYTYPFPAQMPYVMQPTPPYLYSTSTPPPPPAVRLQAHSTPPLSTSSSSSSLSNPQARSSNSALALTNLLSVSSTESIPAIDTPKSLTPMAISEDDSTSAPNSRKNSKDNSSYIHKCHMCEKSFKRKSWLRRHLLSHSAERHFSCPWCLSKHKRRDNLLQHMKLKHSHNMENSIDPSTAIATKKGKPNKKSKVIKESPPATAADKKPHTGDLKMLLCDGPPRHGET